MTAAGLSAFIDRIQACPSAERLNKSAPTKHPGEVTRLQASGGRMSLLELIDDRVQVWLPSSISS